MTRDEEKTLDESMMQYVRDIKVVGALLNGDKLCDHAHAMLYGNNFEEPFSMIICPVCQLQGPKAKTGEQTQIEFWKKIALDRGRYLELMKGMKPMSTEDYKRGVEDTLSILDDGQTIPNVAKAYVRKKLLTKKVTKWVIVNKEGTAYRTSNLFDCQSDADRGSRRADGKVADYVLGVYPIEIDLPL